MNIPENIKLLQKEIPSSVKLVAISKTKPVSDILEAYYSGFTTFGENKVQELIKKQEDLPEDIEWHMVGHLQTNKVKYIAPFVNMIQSVDSLKLLKIIDKEARKHNRIINCLLQLHIAMEETKFGLSLNEVQEILESPDFKLLKNARIVGLMGMATFTSEEEVIRMEFKFLADCFIKLKKDYFPTDKKFKEISMGMSGDYKIAIEEGSTMIRVGSLIFGSRSCSVSTT
ncbi:MAG: YggS family pyridoxal phosphate-dependent enzyme [Bacteroidales bacterium]|nr:YggS family pyridoxal phosphate-dependent enzyme [Bacteroidales bacterium]